jgi:hypothetical protein
VSSRRRAGSAPSSPAAAAIQDFLLWARANGFAVHAVTFGEMAVTVADLQPATVKSTRGAAAAAPAREPGNAYEAFGGELWQRAQAQAEREGAVDADDDDPPPAEDEGDDDEG